MDAKLFEELKTKLWNAQYRKSRGIVSTPLLERFVRFVEVTEEKLENFSPFEPCKFTMRVTLAPRTTEKEYDTINTPVGYCGPYTAVHFENGEFSIERVDSQTEWYEAYREYDQGAKLEIKFTGSAFFSLEELINVIEGKAELGRSYVWLGKDGDLTFSFLIPTERLI